MAYSAPKTHGAALRLRPAVVDHALEKKLAEYLRFRHLFRHTYELEWEKVCEMSEALPDLLEALKAQLSAFSSALTVTQEGK